MNIQELYSSAATGTGGRRRAAWHVREKGRSSQDFVADDTEVRELAAGHRQDRDALAKAARSVGESLESLGLELKFRTDGKGEPAEAEIVDPASGRVMKKLPPEDLLRLSSSIGDVAGGLLDRRY